MPRSVLRSVAFEMDSHIREEKDLVEKHRGLEILFFRFRRVKIVYNVGTAYKEKKASISKKNFLVALLDEKV